MSDVVVALDSAEFVCRCRVLTSIHRTDVYGHKKNNIGKITIELMCASVSTCMSHVHR